MISIIVPIYNIEKYLPECIESVLAQSFTDYECILVDDGSTDRSGAIADEYAERDSRIRVIHKKNGGLSSARNAGLDVVRGEYFYFLDGDDCIYKNALQTLWELAQTYPESDIIQGAYDRGEFFTQKNYVDGGKISVLSQSELIDDFIYFKRTATIVCSKLWKTKVFGTFRFDDKCYVLEDVEYLARTTLTCNKMVVTDEIGYFYRQTPGSLITQGLNLRKLKGSVAAQQKCIETMKPYPLICDRVWEWHFSGMFNWLYRSKKANVPEKKEIAAAVADLMRRERHELLAVKQLSTKIRLYLLTYSFFPKLSYKVLR